MNHHFDELAKAAGRGLLSRREAFWRFGGAFVLAVGGAVGLVRAQEAGCVPRGCAMCCRLRPLTGPEHKACMQACLKGQDFCGESVAPGCAGQP